MKWHELIKKMEKAGYQFQSHGKKHDLYAKGTNIIMAERHGNQEVRKGLLTKILKQLDG
jgi:mRNA interferase HicA